MASLDDLTCTKCGATASFVKVNGVTCNPPGWSFVMVRGLPIINGELCPTCAPMVRAYIETPPAPVALHTPTYGPRCATRLCHHPVEWHDGPSTECNETTCSCTNFMDPAANQASA